MSRLILYTFFHLNLAYSSIEEGQQREVIQKCYWPLLKMARKYNLPFGIEASAYTLETVAGLDPDWGKELGQLTGEGPCDFIGSGYTQIIGPLAPAEVNAANLRLGHNVYERLLGFRPGIAMVNEQAYSAGLIQHYLEAGYRAVIMEWDNPARFHPDWDPEWRYLPQMARGQQGQEIPIIWNQSIAFQKFQRYVHNEIELEEYLDYLCRHLSEFPRVFPLYGSDVEIFDFRPKRYTTEAALQKGVEWQRISRLFEVLLADGRFQFIRPSEVLELLKEPRAGQRLHLESAEQPIPVKKQDKYNITRWAATGRDNLGINTACWQIYQALKTNAATDDTHWRELCYLWSSDFRTHITESRWITYQERLRAFKQQVGIDKQPGIPSGKFSRGKEWGDGLRSSARIGRQGRYLIVETDTVKVSMNCHRGLAIDGLWFKGVSEQPLAGTLYHGYFDDIALGADYYTGHLVLEIPGQPKVTDLNPVDPEVEKDQGILRIWADIPTRLGTIRKSILVEPRGEIGFGYELDWAELPKGTLRLGYVTLNPAAFTRSNLYFQTHNGGFSPESFPCNGRPIEHGRAVSLAVSASSALGVTAGNLSIGDHDHVLKISVDQKVAFLVAQITYLPIGHSCFCRVGFSAAEFDDTVREGARHQFTRHFGVRLQGTRPQQATGDG